MVPLEIKEPTTWVPPVISWFKNSSTYTVPILDALQKKNA